MPAPTATELAGNQVVLEALELAWSDSTSLDPINRHEEGGWIYLEVTTGRLIVRRAPAGKQASVNLSTPLPTAGAVIVGNSTPTQTPPPTAGSLDRVPQTCESMPCTACPTLFGPTTGRTFRGPTAEGVALQAAPAIRHELIRGRRAGKTTGEQTWQQAAQRLHGSPRMKH